MAREVYDSNKENWSVLFNNQGVQSGSGKISYFAGGRPQIGSGIGGILRRILRAIPSFLNSPIGKSLVSAGANIASDVREGAPLGDSVKTHARSTVRNLTGVGKRGAQVGGSARVIGFLRKGAGPKKRRRGGGVASTNIAPLVRRAFIR